MSFGDPFGPLRPGIGPDIVQEGFSRRPDIPFELAEFNRPARGLRFRSFLKSCGYFAGATVVLTALVSVPVFISEMAMIETVGTRGQTLSAAEFAARLENLFIGSFIVAVSLVSFIASAALSSPRQGARAMEKDSSSEEQQGAVDPALSALVRVHHV